GALDLSDPSCWAGQETGEQWDRPTLVHPLQLDGPDRPGREPFEVGRDADPARLVRLVPHGDGKQGVGGGVKQVVDAGGDGLEPQGGGDLQSGRLGAEERAQGSAGGLAGGTLCVPVSSSQTASSAVRPGACTAARSARYRRPRSSIS